MKPAPFLYVAAASRAHAVENLVRHGDEAKVLAGGQSLVPFMNFRLATPGVLVDINRITDLDYLIEDKDVLRIGALIRHHRFEQPVIDGPLGGLLGKVAHHIAHLPIRMRGTFLGSIAHADPASEWCTLAVALDAEMVVEGTGGARHIPAGDFFRAPFMTQLGETELICEVRLPVLGRDWNCGFAEVNRRIGDFALVAVVTAVQMKDGLIASAKIAVGGAAGHPFRARQAEQTLEGAKPGDAAWRMAAEVAADQADPMADAHATAEYRRHLVRAMTRRALADAFKQ